MKYRHPNNCYGLSLEEIAKIIKAVSVEVIITPVYKIGSRTARGTIAIRR